MQLGTLASLMTLALGGCFSPELPFDRADESGSSTRGDPNAEESASTAASVTTTSSATSESTSPPESSTGQVDESGSSEGDPGSSSGIPTSESSSSTGEPADCVGVATHTVWVSFDGGTLEEGLVENAPANVTDDPFQVGVWQSYDDADVDELFDLIRAYYAPFDVCLTREEPAVLDYNLVLVTSETYEDNPNHPGFAPVDCEDMQANNTAVVILSSEANLPTTTKAIALGKQIAKLYGLESVSATDDLMNYPISNTLNSATFTDACHEHVLGEQLCDGAPGCLDTEHNSFASLAAALGLAS